MNYIFPTASTTAVFLNGYHIDLAYQVQYKETQNKIPIYGYSDYTYSKIALGKKIVQGILVINFTFPGYLNAVLDGTIQETSYPSKLHNLIPNKSQAELSLKNQIKQSLRTELPPNTGDKERAARAEYIASIITKNKEGKKAVKEALNEFLKDDVVNAVQGLKDLPSPISLNREDLYMDVYYQDPAFQTWFLRFNKVNFNEVSQTISQAGAEGSSDPLFEVYQFIASEKIIKIIDTSKS